MKQITMDWDTYERDKKENIDHGFYIARTLLGRTVEQLQTYVSPGDGATYWQEQFAMELIKIKEGETNG